MHSSRRSELTGSTNLELPGLGVLDFHCSGGGIDLLADDYDDRSYPQHPLAEPIVPSLVVREWATGFALADRYGKSLFFIDRRERELRKLLDLYRTAEDDPGFMFVDFLEIQRLPDLLVLYERGIARITPDLRCLWHNPTPVLNLRFLYYRDDVLHMDDGSEGGIAIRCSDGSIHHHR